MSRTHRSSPSFRRVGAMVAVGALSLAACGGGDDDEAATTTAAATTSPDTTTASTTATTPSTTASPSATSPSTSTTTADAPTASTTEDEDDDPAIITGLDELPRECVDALAEFLRAVEPVVSDIDWDTATLADFEAISGQLEEESSILDEPGLACDDFDFASDAESLQALIDFAEEEAPGVIGWLEFIGQLGTEPPSDGTASEGPQNCAEAIAYIEDLVGQGLKMTDMPVSELSTVTQAFNLISVDCDQEQSIAFLDRPEIAIFLS